MKTVYTRMSQKHDFQINWEKYSDFIPMNGEIVIYDAELDSEGNVLTLPDGTKVVPEDRKEPPHRYQRMKIGNGVTCVNDLPFTTLSLEQGLSPASVQQVGASAGTLGYYYSYIDITNKKIYLSNTQVIPEIGTEDRTDTSFETPDYPIPTEEGGLGGQLCIVNSSNYNYGGNYGSATIVSVSNNVITYAGDIGFTEINVLDELGTDDYTVFVVERPDVGAVSVRENTTAFGTATKALGSYSVAEGGGSIAVGKYGHAEGKGTIAHHASHSEGQKSKALGHVSHAEGNSTTALGDYSHAEGSKTNVEATYGHAEGYDSKALNTKAYAAHAEGMGTTASAQAAHSEGQSTTASGASSHAEGSGTTASGSASHAEGSSSTAEGSYSHAEGRLTKALGTAAHTEGVSSEATTEAAHAEGKGTHATGSASHAEGSGTTASGNSSHAGGLNTEASGAQAVTFGSGTKATKANAFAIGSGSQANGENSFAGGHGAKASGSYSFAFGNGAEATAAGAAAVGMGALASGTSGFAVGSKTSVKKRSRNLFNAKLITIDNEYTTQFVSILEDGTIHSEGTGFDTANTLRELCPELEIGKTYKVSCTVRYSWPADASGARVDTLLGSTLEESFASPVTEELLNSNLYIWPGDGYEYIDTDGDGEEESYAVVANSELQIMIYEGTEEALPYEPYYINENIPATAKGVSSVAIGQGAVANGQGSVALGLGTIATRDRQFVFGQYNKEDTEKKYAHIVGWGWTPEAPVNIHTLDTSGNAWYKGTVYVGGSEQAKGNKVATEKVVDEKIAKVIANADTKYDTLKEISDWILSDTTGAAKMANDISQAKTDISTLQEDVTKNKTAAEEFALEKIDEFHNLTGLEKFDELSLPTEVYYEVIEKDWINTLENGTQVYDFENLKFTTKSEGNTKLENLYTYLDTWGNRCYTLNANYIPNIKESESVVSIFERDPDNMLYSIKLEAKFRGEGTYALGNKNFSLLAGQDVVADGNGAVASGRETFVSGANANSFGMKNLVRGNTASAFGYNNIVTGTHAVAFNEANKVLGYASFGWGDHNEVLGAHSSAGGWQNKTAGQYNFASGSENTLDGDYIVGFGNNGNYKGGHILANGNKNIIDGLYNISNGYKNTLIGDDNTVNGLNNKIGVLVYDKEDPTKLIAKVPSSQNTVFGTGNEIIRTYDETETDEQRAKKNSSGHIINGVENKIEAEPSYRNFINGQGNVIGSTTNEKGQTISGSGYSVVSGVNNFISSRFGSAIGEGLKVEGHYGTQLVIGKYNKIDKWAHFIVGSGKSDTDRKNIFTIKNDGRAVLGADPKEKMDAVTKQYMETAIKNEIEPVAPKLENIEFCISSSNSSSSDDTVKYVKTVPADVAPYAKLQKIEGKTIYGEIISVSENLLDVSAIHPAEGSNGNLSVRGSTITVSQDSGTVETSEPFSIIFKGCQIGKRYKITYTTDSDHMEYPPRIECGWSTLYPNDEFELDERKFNSSLGFSPYYSDAGAVETAYYDLSLVEVVREETPVVVTEVVSKDVSGSVLDRITIPTEVLSLEGYGKNNHYIEWDNNHCVWWVTPNSTREDITNYFTEDNLFKVVAGGTVTFVNSQSTDVPSTITYEKKGLEEKFKANIQTRNLFNYQAAGPDAYDGGVFFIGYGEFSTFATFKQFCPSVLTGNTISIRVEFDSPDVGSYVTIGGHTLYHNDTVCINRVTRNMLDSYITTYGGDSYDDEGNTYQTTNRCRITVTKGYTALPYSPYIETVKGAGLTEHLEYTKSDIENLYNELSKLMNRVRILESN